MYEVALLEGLAARAFRAIAETFDVMARMEKEDPGKHAALLKQVDELYRLVIGHAAKRELCPAVVIVAAMCAVSAAVENMDRAAARAKAKAN